jgi:hypothetical protein
MKAAGNGGEVDQAGKLAQRDSHDRRRPGQSGDAMEIEHLFETLQINDLQWFIPVVAGLVIIVGGLLIGMIRGMSGGVIVALLFGGLMSLSPTLLETLERSVGFPPDDVAPVARSAAGLAIANREALGDLSGALGAVGEALDGLPAALRQPGDAAPNPAVARLADSLEDLRGRIAEAIAAAEQGEAASLRLESALEDMAAGSAPGRR